MGLLGFDLSNEINLNFLVVFSFAVPWSRLGWHVDSGTGVKWWVCPPARLYIFFQVTMDGYDSPSTTQDARVCFYKIANPWKFNIGLTKQQQRKLFVKLLGWFLSRFNKLVLIWLYMVHTFLKEKNSRTQHNCNWLTAGKL